MSVIRAHTAPGRQVTAVLALLLAVCTGQAQELGVRARVDSTVYLVGDRITVHVDLRHTRGLTIQPLAADSIGGFALLGRTPLRPTTDTTGTIDFVLARYDSGDAVVPPIPFMYFVGGDTASRVALTNQLRVTITTVPLDTTGEIKDVKPPFSIPISLEEIALYAGIALLTAAVAFFGYRFWKKRRARRKGEVYVPPPRPAHVIALEELALLKEKQLWQQGLVKQYYSELTEILRRYFENRYRLPALEETTDEIVAGLSGAGRRRLRCGIRGIGFAPGGPGEVCEVSAGDDRSRGDRSRGCTASWIRHRVVEMTPVPAQEAKGAGRCGIANTTFANPEFLWGLLLLPLLAFWYVRRQRTGDQ